MTALRGIFSIGLLRRLPELFGMWMAIGMADATIAFQPVLIAACFERL